MSATIAEDPRPCGYCWGGHEPDNRSCPANAPENLIDVDGDERLLREGAQYNLMLCSCAPEGGFAPVHPECDAAVAAMYDDEDGLA